MASGDAPVEVAKDDPREGDAADKVVKGSDVARGRTEDGGRLETGGSGRGGTLGTLSTMLTQTNAQVSLKPHTDPQVIHSDLRVISLYMTCQ